MTPARKAALRRLARLLEGDVCLPQLDPEIALVHEFLERDDFHMQELADVVSLDPAVSAGVVRAANTAHYSRGKLVGSLRDACVRIGPKPIVAIALEVGVAAKFIVHAEPFASILRDMWRNSIVTSRVTGELARALSLQNPERLRAAALFHNIGELVVVQLLAESPVGRAPSLDLIASLVRVNHERLGRKLTEKWMLPHSVRRLAGRHHRVRPGAESPSDKLARELILAAWDVAVSAGYSYLPGQVGVDVERVLESLGLGPEVGDRLSSLIEAWEV